jgi:V8-like Glu-specific endopeptidase
MQLKRIALLVGIVLLATLPAAAQQTLSKPLPEPMLYRTSTGPLSNPDTAERLLHDERVHIAGAAWMRLYFGNVELGRGSYLRITSEADGEVQLLDAEALAMWSDSTAYFNGDTVRVELVGGPRTETNLLQLDRVAWDLEVNVPTGSCGICGPDDRVPSFEDFAARLLPSGCSATVYNSQSCMVSAGHCISGGMVVQFKVPPSNQNCGINQPPVSEQFPVTAQNFSNGGVGQDWAVMTIGTNSLGETPYDRYGLLKPIATTPPQVGDFATIWGYGVDNQCTQNQVQQTSNGSVSSVLSLHLRHGIDATFGNSGSSLIRNGEEIIGIATHCPCPNVATRIDHPSFVAARANLCPALAQHAATLLDYDVQFGTHAAGGVAEMSASDGLYFEVDSEPGGLRNNTLTVVDAQLSTPDPQALSVIVDFGPATTSPIFYMLQILNHDLGSWEILSFGITSTVQNTTVEHLELPGADNYVDGSGVVSLRVIETARAVQTPGGFTKRIDRVEVLFAP